MAITKKEWEEKIAQVRAIRPDIKEIDRYVDTLDLIMAKANAKDIIDGRKKVEYRKFSDFYIKRMMDMDCVKSLEKYKDDEEVIALCAPYDVRDVIDPVKIIYNIHFHDYKNSWSLDVECIDNDLRLVTPEEAEYMYEEFKDEEMLRFIEEQGDDFEPFNIFFLAIGEIKNRINI